MCFIGQYVPFAFSFLTADTCGCQPAKTKPVGDARARGMLLAGPRTYFELDNNTFSKIIDSAKKTEYMTWSFTDRTRN